MREKNQESGVIIFWSSSRSTSITLLVDEIMRAFPVSRDCRCFSYHPLPLLLLAQTNSSSYYTTKHPFLPPKFSNNHLNPTKQSFLLQRIRPNNSNNHNPHCSNPNPTLLDGFSDDEDDDDDDDVGYEDDDDYYSFVGDDDKEDGLSSASISEDGLVIQVKKLGKNSRRIRSKISINASLDAVWKILTDYEKLADFIPGLAVSKLIEKKDNFARLYQIGQQNLLFGLKFNAKAVLDCYEKELQSLASVKKRDIEFKMTEGDFQFFEGKWSIEQSCKPISEDSNLSVGEGCETTLSYLVDVKPKLWLPVHLVEGRICNEIKTNLSCIRDEAQKLIHDTLQDD